MANHVPALESIVSGIKLQYHINYRHAILMHCPLCFGNENKMDWLVLRPGLGSHLLAMELRGRQNNLPKLQQRIVGTHKMPTPLHFTHANPLGVRGQAPNPVPSLAERYDRWNGRGKFCRFSACFAYRTPKKSDSVNSVKQEIKSKGKMIIPAVIIVPINNNNLPMPILSAVASFVCPCNCP